MTVDTRYESLKELVAKWAAQNKQETRPDDVPDLLMHEWVTRAHRRHSLEPLQERVEQALSSEGNNKGFATILLGAEFLKTAERGNPGKLKVFLDGGFPVNYQDPTDGATALHILAAGGARKALRVILKSNKLDFCLRDKKERLVSEMAYLYGRDVAMSRLLGNKARKQAAAQGITLTRRPRPE